jgi:hypothetical protein
MSKKVYSDFRGGLSDCDRNAQDSQFYAGRDIDIFRNYGYLSPGYSKTDITVLWDDAEGELQKIVDLFYDTGSLSASKYLYIFCYGKIYCIDTTSFPADQQETNFNVINGKKGIFIAGGYSTQLKSILTSIALPASVFGASSYTGVLYNYVLFSYNEYNNSPGHNDMGIGLAGTNAWYISGGTQNCNTSMYSTIMGHYLNDGNRDLIDWKTYIFYTNGRYVGKFDPSVNPVAAGSFDDVWTDLGANWTSDCFFMLNNYLAVIAHKSNTTINNSRVYFFNISGDLMNITELEGTLVNSVKNRDGTIILFSNDGSNNVIATLQNEGLENVKILQHDVNNSLTSLAVPPGQAIVSYKNGLLFGASPFLMNYGRRTINDNFVLSSPFSTSVGTVSQLGTIGAIKNGSSNKYYVGHYDGVNNVHKLSQFSSGNSPNASLKFPYEDLGQRILINYVKVYFKPLASGDALTVGLDIDYGTSVSLGDGASNISYTKHGAITSKRFDLKKNCHSFRPTISWVSGGVAISKIIVDYSFVDDI